MTKYLVCLLSLAVVGTARADHKADHKGGGAFTMNGSIEAGLATAFGGSSTKGFDWLVDNVEMKNDYTISDKTHATIMHGFSAARMTAPAASFRGAGAGSQDSRAFYSPATIGAGGTLAYEVREAYLTHQCSDKISTSVGLFRNVFGMENMWDRYDMANYYYSRVYGMWQGFGWNYALGAKWNIHGLEATLFQSGNTGPADGKSTPGVALRYKFDVAGGDWTLTPVLSAYLGKWYGGPKDMAFSGGAMWKMGTLWANAEFEFGQTKTLASVVATKDWSIIVEPGFDLGLANLSAKWEFTSTTAGAGAAVTDMNLSAALSKSYDKFRTRLAYVHSNLGGKIGVHANEIRLLFGAEW